jgi:hypothetical protein
MNILKGDRLKTDHGMATVIGFERFNSKGFTAPMADTIGYTGERIICTLDSDNTWPCTGNYAAFQHDLVRLNK